jgi:hypothetical protein
MNPKTILCALAALGLCACEDTRSGFAPVLGDEVTTAEKERFARRLHLDLTGLPPTPDQTAELIRRLDEEGNTAETRGAVAAGIIASPEAASFYLTETGTTAFSGSSVAIGYYVVCEIQRAMDPACGSCDEADPCECTCPAISAYAAEESAYLALAQDLGSGGDTTTSDIERTLCQSAPFLYYGTSPEGISTQVFQLLLGRPPEADELKNARFMTLGSYLPGSPSGVLFHQPGESYEDLLDIVIGSEVYRDAMVTRTFQRYLGRRPSGDELRSFSASLDAERPDLRPLVQAVVSSSEYFQQ